MRITRHQFFQVSRSDVYRIYPFGDVHVGAGACNESALSKFVKRVAESDEKTYTLFMGDACDFINVHDKRFDPLALAPWMKTKDLADIVTAEKEHFQEAIKPIVPRMLCWLKGNHEETIQRHYERDVYAEMISWAKTDGGCKREKIALGYTGWLILDFYRSDVKKGSTRIVFTLHHGFGGGRGDGGKTNNAQGWLSRHDCDVALFGHVHTAGAVPPIAVEKLSRTCKPYLSRRWAAYTGTFLETAGENYDTYSEIKAYYPLPLGGVEIELRPGAEDPNERIRLISY